MEEFILKSQTFEGICDILKNTNIESLVSTVSALTGIAPDKMQDIKSFDLGSGGEKNAYAAGIKELKKTIPFLWSFT